MFSFMKNLFCKPHPVETREEALRIAQYEVQKKFSGDFSSYQFSLGYDPETDLWKFRYMSSNVYSGFVFGGIGPGVTIRRSDGKITYLKGQK